MKIKSIYNFLDHKYSFSNQDEYDNSGIFNSLDINISDVLICLDITSRVIEYAKENDINLIISHHPIFFNKFEISSIQKKLIQKIKNYNITCIFLHTPFDKSPIGMNYHLAKKIGLKNIKFLDCSQYIAFGELKEPSKLKNLSKELKDILKTNIFYLKKFEDKTIYKVAICGGSGSSMMKDILQSNIDLFITGDIKHHAWIDSIEYGITLLDVSHFVENVFIDIICDDLIEFDDDIRIHNVKEKNIIKVI